MPTCPTQEPKLACNFISSVIKNNGQRMVACLIGHSDCKRAACNGETKQVRKVAREYSSYLLVDSCVNLATALSSRQMS